MPLYIVYMWKLHFCITTIVHVDHHKKFKMFQTGKVMWYVHVGYMCISFELFPN